MRSEFYCVIGVHVVLRYDHRSKNFRKGRVWGSFVINNYSKAGNWKLISKTNTLSLLCITIYIYVYIYIYIYIYSAQISQKQDASA